MRRHRPTTTELAHHLAAARTEAEARRVFTPDEVATGGGDPWFDADPTDEAAPHPEVA